MKRRGLYIFLTAVILVLNACGTNSPAETDLTPSPTPATYVDEGEDQAYDLTQIGFSIAGDGAFYDQLKSDIEAECAARGFTFSLLSAETAEQQISDIMQFIESGVLVLVVNPVDVDALESVLAECETEGVPVINIINSINGRVSTLISPDFSLAGERAGERAVSLFGDTGGRCLELKTEYDSFIMQLLSDGFEKALAQSANVTLVSEQFCGDDEEQAYLLAKTELLSREKDIDFVFAQSAALAHGALRAIADTESEAKLVAFAGDMNLIAAVASGEMDAAIFFGPAELAQTAVENAGLVIDNPSHTPHPFLALQVDVVTAENATDYYTEGNLHAQISSD